jgi:hypothetical protein
VVVTSTLPAGIEVLSIEGGEVFSAKNKVEAGYVTTGVISRLQPGESYTLTWTVHAIGFLGNYLTQATVASDSSTIDLSNLQAGVYRVGIGIVYYNYRP